MGWRERQREAVTGVHGETKRGSRGGLARAGRAVRREGPPVLKPGKWAAPAPSTMARALRAAADACDRAGLAGSAQRMRELSSDLDADGSAENARDVSRTIAEAVLRARAEGPDGASVRELWERVLPRGAARSLEMGES